MSNIFTLKTAVSRNEHEELKGRVDAVETENDNFLDKTTTDNQTINSETLLTKKIHSIAEHRIYNSEFGIFGPRIIKSIDNGYDTNLNLNSAYDRPNLNLQTIATEANIGTTTEHDLNLKRNNEEKINLNSDNVKINKQLLIESDNNNQAILTLKSNQDINSGSATDEEAMHYIDFLGDRGNTYSGTNIDTVARIQIEKEWIAKNAGFDQFRSSCGMNFILYDSRLPDPGLESIMQLSRDGLHMKDAAAYISVGGSDARAGDNDDAVFINSNNLNVNNNKIKNVLLGNSTDAVPRSYIDEKYIYSGYLNFDYGVSNGTQYELFDLPNMVFTNPAGNASNNATLGKTVYNILVSGVYHINFIIQTSSTNPGMYGALFVYDSNNAYIQSYDLLYSSNTGSFTQNTDTNIYLEAGWKISINGSINANDTIKGTNGGLNRKTYFMVHKV